MENWSCEDLYMTMNILDLIKPVNHEPVFSFTKTCGTRIDKTHNKRINTITTNVFYKDHLIGTATCDETEYDERQGILNAIANAVFGNFDREYDKYKKFIEKEHQEACKCSACGKVYVVPEQARECEAQHIKNKKERRERYHIRAEAKRRLAAEEYEKKVVDMMNKISKEEN